MTTSGDGGGSGADGSEEVERYKVDGVTYGVHRAATIFPFLTEREFDELVKDVAKNGLREPVYVRGLEIVDGRNRLRAALEAGTPVRFEVIGDDVDLYGFVASKNLHRRHLTPSQLAMIALDLVRLSAEERELHMRREGAEKANHASGADSGSVRAPLRAAIARGWGAFGRWASGRRHRFGHGTARSSTNPHRHPNV